MSSIAFCHLGIIESVGGDFLPSHLCLGLGRTSENKGNSRSIALWVDERLVSCYQVWTKGSWNENSNITTPIATQESSSQVIEVCLLKKKCSVSGTECKVSLKVTGQETNHLSAFQFCSLDWQPGRGRNSRAEQCGIDELATLTDHLSTNESILPGLRLILSEDSTVPF